MKEHALDTVEFVETEIPESCPPVAMARLAAGRGRLSALVRFPAGWRRPTAGSYTVDETVVVLDGALTVTGVTAGAGCVLWVPAQGLREGSETPAGALCFARFGGPPAWHAGAGRADPPLLPAAGGELDTPAGPGRRLALPEGAPALHVVEGISARTASVGLEILALDARRWLCVDEGESIPQVEGRCLILVAGRP